VPADAEPGDHIGAVVAEGAPSRGQVRVIKRVATRISVTVPGEATRSDGIAGITKRVDNSFNPHRVDVAVGLRNNGRIRLHPQVRIGGRPGLGSRVLVAQSVERYRASVQIPWYGGRLRIPVDTTTEAGTHRQVVELFVVPWLLIASALVLLAALSVGMVL
jgi:hypothetical protein